MRSSPVLRFTILLLALAFLLPLAATADSCTDCLYGGAPGCCPPSCCSCCAPGAPAPAVAAWASLRLVTAEAAPSPREAVYPSSHPHDIFHVPKA